MSRQAFTMPHAYKALVEVALASGARDIRSLPGCFEYQIDARWWMASNGHTTPRKTSNGATVPPFAIYVERDGMPAALIELTGGTALGDLEAELIAACRAAETALKGGAA